MLDESPLATARPTGAAIDAWNYELQQRMAGGLSRTDAVRRLVAERPELHERYIRQYNACVGRDVNFESRGNGGPASVRPFHLGGQRSTGHLIDRRRELEKARAAELQARGWSRIASMNAAQSQIAAEHPELVGVI